MKELTDAQIHEFQGNLQMAIFRAYAELEQGHPEAALFTLDVARRMSTALVDGTNPNPEKKDALQRTHCNDRQNQYADHGETHL